MQGFSEQRLRDLVDMAMLVETMPSMSVLEARPEGWRVRVWGGPTDGWETTSKGFHRTPLGALRAAFGEVST